MLRPVIYIFLLTICASCGIGHSIKIMSDKSAFVKSWTGYNVDSLRMTKSPIISEFKLDGFWCSFKIADIDSLGNYMGDVINRGYFNFKYYPDSLIIFTSKTPPLKKEWDAWYCCGYTMKVNSDRQIKTIVKRNKRIKFRNKEQEVDVGSQLKKHNRRTKPTNLTIVFEK